MKGKSYTGSHRFASPCSWVFFVCLLATATPSGHLHRRVPCCEGYVSLLNVPGVRQVLSASLSVSRTRELRGNAVEVDIPIPTQSLTFAVCRLGLSYAISKECVFRGSWTNQSPLDFFRSMCDRQGDHV